MKIDHLIRLITTIVIAVLLMNLTACIKDRTSIPTIPQKEWNDDWFTRKWLKDTGPLSIDTVEYINGKYVAVPLENATPPYHIVSIYSLASETSAVFENFYNCADKNGVVWQIPQKSLYRK